MSRYQLRVIHERISKCETYNGYLELLDTDSNTGSFRIEFKDRELMDVAEQMHFLTRVLAMSRDEFVVVSVKSAPGAQRPPVPVQFTVEQVNRLFESVKSAREFFAPLHMTRNLNLKGGQDGSDAAKNE